MPVILMLYLGLILFPFPASAGPIKLRAQKPIKIYELADKKSSVLAQLQVGETFFLSRKNTGEWRKVLVLAGPERVIGWSQMSHLKNGGASKVKVKESELYVSNSSQESPEYLGNTGLGVSFSSSLMNRGKRTFTTSDDDEWTVAESSSLTYFFSMFADLNFGPRFVLRPYLNLRTTNFESESTSNLIGTVNTSFEQSFLGLGVLAKWYSSRNRKLWYGVALEGAQGQSLTITFDNDQLQTTDDELSFYMIGSGAIGYDIHIWEKLFLLPEVRFGAVGNQDPMIFFGEAHLSAGWTL